MDTPFLENHASAASQLEGHSPPLGQSASTYEGWMDIGRSLTKELRYLEAAEAYSQAIHLQPLQCDAYRQRAGKYLATLQPEKAILDFEKCRSMGAEESDICYRLGLCWYYAGLYRRALAEFQQCWNCCDEELGIGVIYWSMICAWRLDEEPKMLSYYRTDMDVGHHGAYAFAVQTVLGILPLADALQKLDAEKDDLAFSMMAYGIAAYCEHLGLHDMAVNLYSQILKRDSFWISFGYLAAWNDRKRGRIC